MPQVSFDIRLGEKYSFVDFDYEGFRSLVHSQGGNDEHFEDAKILVGPPKSMGGGLMRGYYSHSDGQIGVGTRKKLNSTLAHEVQHYIDMTTGEDTGKGVGKGNLSNISLVGFGSINIASQVLELIPIDMVESIGEGVYDITLYPMLLATAGYFRYYHFTKRERRARKAGKQHGYKEIIKLVEA